MSFFSGNALFLVASGLGVFSALLLIYLVVFPSRLKNATKLDTEASVALLMHDDRLINETPGARQLLQIQSGQSVAWAEVHSAFTVRFPSLPDEFQIAMSQAPTQIPSRLPHDSACLMLEAAGAGLRLSLIQESDDNCVVLHHEAIQDQISLNTLTRAIAMAPFAVWMVDSSNEHAWHNPEYERLLKKVHGTNQPDPEKPLFDIHQPTLDHHGIQRVMHPDDSEFGEIWYDITMSRTDGYKTYYANDVTALVRAERAQRSFVQTLTKTFAQLGTGLAIFNRDRDLILFNPALVDLTNLSAEFLSSRPSLSAFFDWLRESRFMPEPRNYSEWRHKLKALTEEAANGTFSELWSQPNGTSYRVFGRPHPDGAIAFLFEDVTAELSLTRNFVKELEIHHGLLDEVDKAIAVFTDDGSLLFVNKAYRALWNVYTDTSVAPTSIETAMKTWIGFTKVTDQWGVVSKTLHDPTSDKPIHTLATHVNGDAIGITAGRLAKGASFVMFSTATVPAGQENLHQSDQNT